MCSLVKRVFINSHKKTFYCVGVLGVVIEIFLLQKNYSFSIRSLKVRRLLTIKKVSNKYTQV